MSALRTPRIIGTAMTALGRHHTSSVELMSQALRSALSNCGLSMDDLEGLVAVPSLSHPHFMEAHNLATYTKLLPRKVRQLPVSADASACPPPPPRVQRTLGAEGRGGRVKRPERNQRERAPVALSDGFELCVTAPNGALLDRWDNVCRGSAA